MVPAAAGGVVAFLMLTWRTGYRLLEQQRSRLRQREDEFIAWVLESRPSACPGRRRSLRRQALASRSA